MSQSSSCGSSSLLQRARPNNLPPQPVSPTLSQSEEQRLHLETHESRHLPEAFRSRSNSIAQQPVASTSSGVMYLNQDPTSSTSTDVALPDRPSHSGSCCTQLAALKAGILGDSIPRAQWQPDSSSALCTFPFCTTIFGASSYFSLAPRRHHCRKCGQIFCGAHSSRRALMYDEAHNITLERVCDLCVGKKDDVETLSRRQSNASEDSELLVTPSENILSRTSTRDDATDLAPVEGWMDKDGVLSLYPLAHPSTARQAVVPAAGPLFAPSKKILRETREREYGLTLRQRRLGEREDFGLKWSTSPSDDDAAEEPRPEPKRTGLIRQRSAGSSRSSSRSRDTRRRVAY